MVCLMVVDKQRLAIRICSLRRVVGSVDRPVRVRTIRSAPLLLNSIIIITIIIREMWGRR
ncbi:unnamed protein product [Medioppia subpectinata]|uniref:Uncharacterized protein n=1 Tax=Medioppia subpectinata TaxID=1979941 RepID=A0A7R9M031_9ACAR|nr:unnamed protein product [Medioppia subpectinata]CAG2123220.1 unnamed protein product [Medioppia subpectinata]